jgi:hypothetical protein
MRDDQLKFPGTISRSLHLRNEVAQAISHIEVTAVGGKQSEAAALKAFFDDASAKLTPYVPVATPPAAG